MKTSTESTISTIAIILWIASLLLFYAFPQYEETSHLKSRKEIDQALLESISMPIIASLEILHPLPESNSMESVQSDILILRSASDKILLLTREKNQKVCLSLFGQNTEVKNILDSISSIRSDCKPRNGAVIIDEFYVQSLRDSVGGQTKYVKLTLSYKDTSKTIHRDAIFPLLSHGNSQEVGL